MPIRRSICLAFACILLLPACGATPAGLDPDVAARRFTPEQLREDLAHLQQEHARRHPRRHQAPADPALERAFEAAASALDRPMGRREAFLHIGRLNPHFLDAHTLVMPLLDEAELPGHAQPRFPFGVRLDAEGRLRLRSDWQREGDQRRLQAGTELVAINGEPAQRLLDRLARYSHGETPALQRHMLGLLFKHWLYAVQGWQGDFVIEIVEEGTTRALAIAPQDRWTPTGAAASAAPRLEFIAEGVAHLRIPSFDVDDDPDAYKRAIDGIFAQLREARADGLIIDVRGNTGGQSEAGGHVIRYLADAPVNQVSRARERLNADNNGLFGYRGQPGTMREMDLSRDGRIQPAPEAQRHRGRTVLLIDAMTYSAAILFATTLQDHGLATLIGQPSGGYGNQTGNMEPIVLPNTRLQAYIPAREFVRPNGDAGAAPVVPDIVVGEGAAGDAGTDATLACALRHLRQASAGAGAGTAPFAGCDGTPSESTLAQDD